MTWTTRPRSEVGSLAAIVAGEGVPVVLLHGVGLRAEAWNRQIDRLAKQAKVIAIDLPGHGQSPPLDGPRTLAGFADALIDSIPEGALIIGHSMGAMLALALAERLPSQVRGLAALNAIFERSPAAQKAVQARAASLDPAQVPNPTSTLERWFGKGACPERDACEDWLQGVSPAGYKSAYSVFANENGPARTTLARLHCPALFLTGADEPNSTPQMSEQMAALCPDGRAQIIDGAAHMMPMTHADQTNTALLTFMAEIDHVDA